MALSQQTQRATFWHQTSLMESKIHTLRTNLECKTLPICLHFMVLLLKKIRNKRSENLILAVVLHKPQHKYDINAVKGSGCFKCGNNDHFIKDCPLSRDSDKKDSSPSHGQHKHYNDYRSKLNDENSVEKSIQAVTDLLRSLLKQNKPSHTTFNKSTHKHSHTNKHSDHKPSYTHSNHRHDKSENRGYHNKGKCGNNAQVNEIGEYISDYNSSCSDQSDEGEEFDSQELSTQDDPKN